MAALDFPDNPATGDLYGSSGTVWRWDGARWASTAGASGASGAVAYAQVTAPLSGLAAAGADLTGLSVTFNCVAGRRYLVTGSVNMYCSVAGVGNTLTLTDGAGTRVQLASFIGATTSNSEKNHLEWSFVAANTTTATYKLRGLWGGGTGTVSAAPDYPSFILVEDITYEAGSSGVGIEPTAWTHVTYKNSWVNPASGQPTQYRKVGDVVQVRGRCQGGAIGTVVFTLPAGFRPPATNNAFPTTSNSAFGMIIVDAAGDVYAWVGSGAEFNLNFQFSVTP